MKVFLDTNILLDVLVERDNQRFTENAAKILGLGADSVIELNMSVLSITTIAYVLKNMTSHRKKSIMKDLTSIVKVLPSLPEHVSNMLDNPMKDIEDTLQVQSAMEGQCDIIVTRDIHDFQDSELPVITPDDLLGRILG